MPGSVLVTGCNGFVGRHLTEYLRCRGERVTGIDRQPRPWADWLPHAAIDIADTPSVLRFVREHDICSIYHLAAVANPRMAREDPGAAVRTNVLGSCSFFEACRERKEIRLLVVGSMEEYKKGDGEALHLSEDSSLDASTFYGVTKICAELVGQGFVRNYGCQIMFTRTFNHTGAGQLPDYVLSSFALQCAEIAAGLREPVIHVGTIDIRRDFLDVADVVRAYCMLMEKGDPGQVYNVSSLQPYLLRELVGSLAGLTGVPGIRIVEEPDRVRSDEPVLIHGDSARLRAQTSWTPEIRIEETLRGLYEFWREEIRQGRRPAEGERGGPDPHLRHRRLD